MKKTKIHSKKWSKIRKISTSFEYSKLVKKKKFQNDREKEPRDFCSKEVHPAPNMFISLFFFQTGKKNVSPKLYIYIWKFQHWPLFCFDGGYWVFLMSLETRHYDCWRCLNSWQSAPISLSADNSFGTILPNINLNPTELESALFASLIEASLVREPIK